MQITRQADYAVRAIQYIASNAGSDKLLATSLVASEMKIPPSFLAKIISQLSIKGLLSTSRGARGGIRLARDAKDISLLDVVEAIDGPIKINECVVDPQSCTFVDTCAMHPVWEDVQKLVVTRLRNTSIASLVE